MAAELSQKEVNALLEEDNLMPDYGEVSQKDIISIFMRGLPHYLREALAKFSRTRIGLSHFQVVVKSKEELFMDNKERFIVFNQPIKDTRFPGEVSLVVTEPTAYKIARTFLAFPEPSLSLRGIKDLQSSFTQFNDGFFSSIEHDYGKAISLDAMRSEETDNPVSLLGTEGFFVEVSFSMTLASISCQTFLILPIGFGGSLAKMIEQEAKVEQGVNTSRPVQFSALDKTRMTQGESNRIDLLLDVSMNLTAELGHTRIKIRDILGLGEGSIIELQKLAGEPVDLLVNGKAIAKGEVVVIDEYFGVRVTEIEAPKEIIRSINITS